LTGHVSRTSLRHIYIGSVGLNVRGRFRLRTASTGRKPPECLYINGQPSFAFSGPTVCSAVCHLPRMTIGSLLYGLWTPGAIVASLRFRIPSTNLPNDLLIFSVEFYGLLILYHSFVLCCSFAHCISIRSGPKNIGNNCVKQLKLTLPLCPT